MNEETKQNSIPEETEDTPEQEEGLLPEDAALAGDGEETDVEAPDEDEEDSEEEAEDDGDGDDADSIVVTTATTIDAPLLDTMVEIMARNTKKNARRNSLIGAVVAAVAAVICLAMQQTVLGFVLWIVAVFSAQSYVTTSRKSARKRLNKFQGQVWEYTFAEDGIHVGKTVDGSCIKWSAIGQACLENGYYVFSTKNSSVVIRQSGLSDSERNALELLMLEHVSECKL